jgi:hypothetical protein
MQQNQVSPLHANSINDTDNTALIPQGHSGSSKKMMNPVLQQIYNKLKEEGSHGQDANKRVLSKEQFITAVTETKSKLRCQSFMYIVFSLVWAVGCYGIFYEAVINVSG